MTIWGTNGPLADLPEILDRREMRAAQQERMLAGGGRCLVSFCMNIPGARKTFPLASAGFREGLRQLCHTLQSYPITGEECYSGITGEEALLLVDADPWEVKRLTTALEEEHPLGRLWDMDVLTQEGKSLSRQALGLSRRTCLLCGEDAKICGHSRKHSAEELFRSTAELLDDYFCNRTAVQVGNCLTRGLMNEVEATPKPGLVDRDNSGSHQEMDISTLRNSAEALTPWFRQFFCLGWRYEGDEPGLFAALRAAGIQAENAMLKATGGVNTHKGMIFSGAVLCGALGRLHAGVALVSIQQLRTACAALGRCALTDFSQDESVTAGLRCYRRQGVRGARGEAAAGFPSVTEIALPALEDWRGRGVSANDASLFALTSLMAEAEDPNMIHQGGYQEAARRREEIRRLLDAMTPDNIVPRLRHLDESYRREDLSPGGCADLLALALAIDTLRSSGIVQ